MGRLQTDDLCRLERGCFVEIVGFGPVCPLICLAHRLQLRPVTGPAPETTGRLLEHGPERNKEMTMKKQLMIAAVLLLVFSLAPAMAQGEGPNTFSFQLRRTAPCGKPMDMSAESDCEASQKSAPNPINTGTAAAPAIDRPRKCLRERLMIYSIACLNSVTS